MCAVGGDRRCERRRAVAVGGRERPEAGDRRQQPPGTRLPDGGVLVITKPQAAPAWLSDALSASGTGVIARRTQLGTLTLGSQGGAAAPPATAAALALANPRDARRDPCSC